MPVAAVTARCAPSCRPCLRQHLSLCVDAQLRRLRAWVSSELLRERAHRARASRAAIVQWPSRAARAQRARGRRPRGRALGSLRVWVRSTRSRASLRAAIPRASMPPLSNASAGISKRCRATFGDARRAGRSRRGRARPYRFVPSGNLIARRRERPREATRVFRGAGGDRSLAARLAAWARRDHIMPRTGCGT